MGKFVAKCKYEEKKSALKNLIRFSKQRRMSVMAVDQSIFVCLMQFTFD